MNIKTEVKWKLNPVNSMINLEYYIYKKNVRRFTFDVESLGKPALEIEGDVKSKYLFYTLYNGIMYN